jgi:hypothetical protein
VSVSQAFPPLGPEFEPFLFAILGQEGNGMPLTIISAIARSGADPWTEAARIAKLPKAAALDVVARMIPDRGGSDNAAIANRLFALLPIARGSFVNTPVARGRPSSPLWNPLIPVVLALLFGLALVAYFKNAPRVGEERLATPSLPSVSDRVDP